MSVERHIATAEDTFYILNITPDFCRINGVVVPFDICQVLKPEQAAYSKTVFARGEPVLLVDSIVKGVKGNGGQGIASGVSGASGHSKVLEGSGTVMIESRRVARHGDLVDMNGKVAGGEFISNKTFGRLHVMSAQHQQIVAATRPAAEQLQILQRRYADHASGRIPLPAEESLELRGAIDRLSKILDPSRTNAWPGYSEQEKAYLAERAAHEQRFRNTIGMEAGGPVLSAMPAAARMMGAPEDIVENLATVNADIAGGGAVARISGLRGVIAGRRAVNQRTPNLKKVGSPGNGLYIDQRSATKPPPDGFKTFQAHGLKEHPSKSPEGRRLIKEYEKLGWTETEAIQKAKDLMETGNLQPLPNPVEIGDRLYKLVPEGRLPGAQSEYWLTRNELEALKGQSVDSIGRHLGMPLESQQTLTFDVVEIKAIRPATSFTSIIAPTSQNGWYQTGGGTQTIILNRDAFTKPVVTGIKFP